jgi:hypothetical protein
MYNEKGEAVGYMGLSASTEEFVKISITTFEFV